MTNEPFHVQEYLILNTNENTILQKNNFLKNIQIYMNFTKINRNKRDILYNKINLFILFRFLSINQSNKHINHPNLFVATIGIH